MSDEGAIEDLSETALFEALRHIDEAFAERAKQFLAGVAPLLATTVRHFPYYTRHDAEHGRNVLKRIHQIVKHECFIPNTPIAFTSTELFLLITAAYAHDLGMTVFPGEEDTLLDTLEIKKEPSWETHPKLQAYLRAEHSRRGGAYIEANSESLGIGRPMISALNKIMRAHNNSIYDLEKDFHLPYAADAQEIDAIQLAIIVCVADALEFSETRVVEGVFDKIKLDPSDAARNSYRENMKHVCIGGSLAIRNDGSVLVSGTFSEEDVLALTHTTFDEMEGWVREYCEIDRRCKRPRLLVRPEPFTRNLDFLGGRFERLGVRLDKKNVIELIASNAAWQNDRGIAIRELVQNAVEACRYRKYHSSAADGYEPAVEVVFNRQNHSITISDNGCGMSERTVLNNFLTVGNSRSREAGYASTNYHPIARFGIGFGLFSQSPIRRASRPQRLSPTRTRLRNLRRRRGSNSQYLWMR